MKFKIPFLKSRSKSESDPLSSKVEPMSSEDYIVRQRIRDVTEYGYTLMYNHDDRQYFKEFTPRLREQFLEIYGVLGSVDLCLVYWNSYGVTSALASIEPWDTKLAVAYSTGKAAGTVVKVASCSRVNSGYRLVLSRIDESGSAFPDHDISVVSSPNLTSHIDLIRKHDPNWVPTYARVDGTRVYAVS